MTSVAEVVAAGATRLVTAGFSPEDAAVDAGVMARHLLGWSLADWLSRRTATPSPQFVEHFDQLISRRAAREPVAYLLGEREFYGRSFQVGPGVLVPRPETEGLVEVALAHLRSIDAASVVDVGTGSGCIAVTIALECAAAGRKLRVIATDASAEALSVARINGERLGVPLPIEWRQADLLSGLAAPVDVIVSNPPYVPERDRDTLAADVRRYEPSSALFGGDDGLDVIRRLIPDAWRCLRPGGRLVMEVGRGQHGPVTTLLEGAAFTGIEWHADLQGIPRVVAAVR